MSNQESTAANAVSIFGKTKKGLSEININLQNIVDTYAFFLEQQANQQQKTRTSHAKEI